MARRQPPPGHQGHHWGCIGGKKQLRTRETAHAPRYSATQDRPKKRNSGFYHFRPTRILRGVGCKVSAWDRAVLVATEGLLGNKWVGEGVETGAKTRSWATAAEWSRPPPDAAPWATAGAGGSRPRTSALAAGSRRPRTTAGYSCRTPRRRTSAARAGSPEFLNPESTTGPSSAPILTTLRTGSQRVSPGPGSSPARANGAPRVGQGPPDVP